MNREIIKILDSHNTDISCGTKALGLAELKKIGCNVPRFWVVSAEWFEKFTQSFLNDDIEQFFRLEKYEKAFKELFISERFVCDNIDQLPSDCSFMVRSSAVPSPDFEGDEFASIISGAFESYYASDKYSLTDCICEVWKSFFSERSYFQMKLFRQIFPLSGMGVVVQEYIQPFISGLVHSGDKKIQINWIEGHLSRLVDGTEIGYIIDIYKNQDGHFIIEGKEDGIIYLKQEKLEETIIMIYNEVRKIHAYCGCPQEVEWLYDGKTVWIVQTQKLIM